VSSRSRQKAGPHPVVDEKAPRPAAEARLSVAPSAVVGEAATLLGGTLDQTLPAIARTAQRTLGADRATCCVISEERCSGVDTTKPDARRRRFVEDTLGLEVAGHLAAPPQRSRPPARDRGHRPGHDDRPRAEVETRVRALSLLVLDLDNFRALNDRHGHGAGDAALRLVARTLEAEIRPGDIAARLRLGRDRSVVFEPTAARARSARTAEAQEENEDHLSSVIALAEALRQVGAIRRWAPRS
jgi:hypothetical protein